MSLEEIDKLIKTMKKNEIFSVKTPDIEIVAKTAAVTPEPVKPVSYVTDTEETPKLNFDPTPATDEQLLFDPYYGLEEQENG